MLSPKCNKAMTVTVNYEKKKTCLRLGKKIYIQENTSSDWEEWFWEGLLSEICKGNNAGSKCPNLKMGKRLEQTPCQRRYAEANETQEDTVHHAIREL